MHSPAPSPFRRRRSRLWQFFERRSFVRHPVSVARARIGVGVLAFIVAAIGFYALSTRDAAIRRRALDFITRATPGGVEVRIGGAKFRLFDGITLQKVAIAVPYSDKLDPRAKDFSQRVIFSAESVKLTHNPWLLFFGKLRVEKVTAVQPTIFLRQNIDNGLKNWQLLSAGEDKPQEKKEVYRPLVTLRSARAILETVNSSGVTESRTETLDADVRPHPQVESGYYIQVRRYTEPFERANVFFDPGQKLVANTPFVDAKTIKMQLPRAAREVFDTISLSGEVRLSRLLYDTEKDLDFETEVILRNVRCDIPLRMLQDLPTSQPSTTTAPDDATSQPATGPASAPSDAVAPFVVVGATEQSLVRMSGITGSVKVSGDDVRFEASGMINRAPSRLVGTLTVAEGGLPNWGVNVAFDASALPLPEGAVRERMLAKDIPRALREFFEDYDPHGKMNVHIEFSRDVNSPGNLATTGHVETLGMRGSTIWFPYPLEDVNGTIRFVRKDIYLDNLRGRHGSGNVNINAHINVATRYSNVDLDILATSIPIDADLHDALPDRYQSVLNRFYPRGMANIHARLFRPGAPADQPKPRFSQRMSIDLIDAVALIEPHPFPLKNVRGHIETDGDRIRIQNLTGESADAGIQIDGYATIRASQEPELELRLEASDLRVDSDWVSGLPENLKAQLQRFNPEGSFDVLGKISLGAQGEGMLWDLSCRLYDAAVTHVDFPYRVDHMNGEINIRPGELEINDVIGSHGDAEISANGKVSESPDHSGAVVDIDFDAQGLPLNQDLFNALPAELKPVWKLFSPRGRMRVRTGLYARTSGDDSFVAHRTELEPLDADITYSGFPLPLSHVTGRILVTHDRVDILSLHATAGTGAVSLTGCIDLNEPGRRGALTIHGRNMSFNKTLIAAMPEGMRGFFQSIRARGPFDLDLAPLRFETNADGQTRWHFDGELGLKTASADFGFKLEKASGVLRGGGMLDEAGTLTFDAHAGFSQAVLAGWHLDKLNCRIHTDDDGRVIHIDNAMAELYGGEAVGLVEIELGKKRSNYTASLTARNLQLDRYIAIHHPATEKADSAGKEEKAQGDIYGNIVLRGRTGRTGFMEGAGELYIREARVWKLPIILAIFQVLNLTPDENVFHDGMLKIYLMRDKVVFNKIDLQGRAMSFIGGGSLDLNTDQLDITLLAGSPVRINLPLLTEVLEGASREIMEIRVRGTFGDPKIIPQPLKSLGVALKTLFPEPPPPRSK